MLQACGYYQHFSLQSNMLSTYLHACISPLPLFTWLTRFTLKIKYKLFHPYNHQYLTTGSSQNKILLLTPKRLSQT